jgi:hypothetical protein
VIFACGVADESNERTFPADRNLRYSWKRIKIRRVSYQYSACCRLTGNQFAGPVLRLGCPPDLGRLRSAFRIRLSISVSVPLAAGQQSHRRRMFWPATAIVCRRLKLPARGTASETGAKGAAAAQPRDNSTEKNEEKACEKRDQTRTKKHVPVALF